MLHLPAYPVPVTTLPPAFTLRVVSAAAARFPSPAQDWEDDALSLVDILRLDRASAFVFRIAGSSMVDAGIHDGDIVVVDKGEKPRTGSIVIAIVEGEFVCRQLEIRRGVATLEARNAAMNYPVCVCDEAVEIEGAVSA